MRRSNPLESLQKFANVRIQYELRQEMGLFPNGIWMKIEEEGKEKEEEGAETE